MYIFTCNLTKYIYIFKNSYTYFPPNLVQKACLQALASIITPSPGFKVSDSRSKKNLLNPGGRIQDSRFSRAFLESRGLGTRFKIQDPKRTS